MLIRREPDRFVWVMDSSMMEDEMILSWSQLLVLYKVSLDTNNIIASGFNRGCVKHTTQV